MTPARLAARPSGTPSSTRASRRTRPAAPTRWRNAADHAKEHDRCGSNLVVPAAGLDHDRQHHRPQALRRRALWAAARWSRRSASARRSRSSRSRRGDPGTRSRASSTAMGHAMQSGFATREPSSGDLLVGQRGDGGPAARRGGRRPGLSRAAVSVSVTVVAPAAPEAAWERWTDIARWPDWNPHCVDAALDGPLAPGTHARPAPAPPARARLLHAAPHHGRRARRARSPGRRAASACARRPAPRSTPEPDGTRVTIEADARGRDGLHLPDDA